MHCEFAVRLDGKVDGKGDDDIGKFVWEGSVSGNALNMIKQYVGKHKVEYQGSIDGRKLAGNWKINNLTDKFQLEAENSDVSDDSDSD